MQNLTDGAGPQRYTNVFFPFLFLIKIQLAAAANGRTQHFYFYFYFYSDFHWRRWSTEAHEHFIQILDEHITEPPTVYLCGADPRERQIPPYHRGA